MNLEFSDPRLVAIYDTVNAYAVGSQPDFYGSLAAELGARTIVDLGCGTGLITRALAAQGHDMIGIDPSEAMVAVARTRPDGQSVHWHVGDATAAARAGADLAIMTGHVAQFFLDDDAWRSALLALHLALRPGGTLAFESRNPLVREWQRWTPQHRVSTIDPVAGRVDTWAEVQEVSDDIVSYTLHYLFDADGAEVLAPCRLRFRSLDELTSSLAEAGFIVRHVFGDWDRRPATVTTRELIVVAST